MFSVLLPKKEKTKALFSTVLDYLLLEPLFAIRTEKRTKFDLPYTGKTRGEGFNMLGFVVNLTA